MEVLVEDYQLELKAVECIPDIAVWSATAHIQKDVSEVMPYLNAVKEHAFYDSDNHYIIWKDGDRKYALRPHELAVSSILDRDQACDIVEQAITLINAIWAQRGEITPDYMKRTPPKLLDILKYLPSTNCRECGVQSCMAFAAGLIEGNRQLADCPTLFEDENKDNLLQLKELGC